MRKLVILALCIAILLSASAMAAMQCSVVPFNNCPQAGVKVIGMTAISDGGSHASIPSEQTNAFVACCQGVEGLSVEYTHEGADIYLTSARDAHVSRVSGENGLKLTASSELSCGYFNECRGYDACVFSISGDRDAHITDCGDNAFSAKLCCREGRLVGEELEISAENETEPAQATPAANEISNTAAQQNNEEPPARSKTRRVALPTHIRNFMRNFLRGGLVGSFLRVPQ